MFAQGKTKADIESSLTSVGWSIVMVKAALYPDVPLPVPPPTLNTSTTLNPAIPAIPAILRLLKI